MYYVWNVDVTSVRDIQLFGYKKNKYCLYNLVKTVLEQRSKNKQ